MAKETPVPAKKPTILVAVDFSEASEHALESGLELAERLGEFVERVYVAATQRPLLPGSAGNRQAARRIAKEASDRARSALGKMQARSDRIVRIRVLRGVPDEQITARAEKMGATFIVMGPIGHSLAATVLLGSTTERVLRHSLTPVLVIPKPTTHRGRGRRTRNTTKLRKTA